MSILLNSDEQDSSGFSFPHFCHIEQRGANIQQDAAQNRRSVNTTALAHLDALTTRGCEASHNGPIGG